MSSCVVPHCRNLLQEWIAPFPADQLLQTRWKHCIEMGTGELLPELDMLDPSAVVCNMHFLGFSSEEQEKQDKAPKRYRQPTLFFRDDLVLEIESCCLCAQVRIKEDMLEKDSPLARKLTMEEVLKEVFGKSYFDETRTCEYVCEMCTARVDILLTIHSHFEAGQLMLKTLRCKQKTESVRFRKNEPPPAIALPHGRTATFKTLEKVSSGKKSSKASNRKKKVTDIESTTTSDHVDPDIPSDPLETVIKVEEATLQDEPDHMQSVSTPEPDLKDKPKNEDEPAVTIPLEKPDTNTGTEMVKLSKELREKITDEAKRTCYLCNAIFDTANILLAHLLMNHKDPDKWRCHDCKLQFTVISTCNNHLKLHDIRRPFPCDHCSLRFLTPYMKGNHQTKVHQNLGTLAKPVITESITQDNFVRVIPAKPELILSQPRVVPAQQVVVKAVPPLALIVDEAITSTLSHPKTLPKISTVEKNSCKTCFKYFESLDILKSHMKSHRSAQLSMLQEPSPEETTDDNMISIPTFNPNPTSQLVITTQQPPLQAPTVTSNLSEGKINGVGIVKLLSQLDLPPLIPFVTKHHSERYPHSCKTCFTAFETQESLKDHIKTHRKPPSDDPVKRKRLTRSRKSKPHPTGTFTCSICSQELPSPAALVKHFSRAHPQLTLDHFRCRFCDDIYFSRETLDVHVASHRGKYECCRCALEFLNPRLLQRHRHAAHKLPLPPKDDCQYCGKSFRRGMTLARHVKTHFAGNWTCEICEESFGERYKLVLHMRQHSGNNPLVCYNCNEHFGDPDMLDQHERACAKHIVSSLNIRE